MDTGEQQEDDLLRTLTFTVHREAILARVHMRKAG